MFYINFHWISPLGRLSHRVAMSVWLSICVTVPSGAVFSRPLIGPQVTWPDPRPLIGRRKKCSQLDQKKKIKKNVTRDMWHVTCDTWHTTRFFSLFFLLLFLPSPPPKKNVGPMIRIGREIQCLPYAGFSLSYFENQSQPVLLCSTLSNNPENMSIHPDYSSYSTNYTNLCSFVKPTGWAIGVSCVK